MYSVYILENTQGRFYVGYSSKDILIRLEEHNQNKNRWTKNKGPWSVRYTEHLANKADAYRRERQIKRYKGGRAFKELIGKPISDGEVA